MATKKPTKPAAAAKAHPRTSPRKLENLAARPPTFDDTLDEQLVDHSGVFRVTSAIAKEQIGHDDGATPRFPNESLVMAAQRDSFREEPESVADDHVIDDETTVAAKRQRLATLAALAERKPRR
ncbi:MAG: hypothetical protein H0T89_14410 [Deltaproteobacteria bacterium]|nr:hypothetical protein [Deltaproteobacteria bacterium]MDQ3296925.1 hypothetical protein [Myxococcota bacterium]